MTRHLLVRMRAIAGPKGGGVSRSCVVRGLGSCALTTTPPAVAETRRPSDWRRQRGASLCGRRQSVTRTQRRRDAAVQVAAEALSTGAVVEVAINLYTVFKARRVNSPQLLKRSYENLLRQIPDASYSKDTLTARKVLLQRAADTMLDSDKRREYDQILANNEKPTMEVEPRYFAGAMVLLQESGEMEQVVELGTRWLNANPESSLCRDVALAVAKAYCDLASITLSSGEGVAFCCEELEEALDLLKACDVAPQLQLDVAGALKELAPQYVLEQIALPDEEQFAERHEKGLSQLKQMIWETDEDGTLSPELNDRQGFLAKARTHLTAAEQIEVYESAPKDVEVPLDEMYDGAMAYIAEGYRAKSPQLIIKAEKVFQRVQLTSLTSISDGSDVSVEMGLCALLLGETDRAMLTLGLKPGSTKPPDKEVVAFVKDNSPAEDDLLPGLCALAEVWLKETILPNYREINMMTSSLGEWFQSPRVSVYLRGKDLSLDSAVRLSGSVARGISNAVSATMEGLRSVFRRPRFTTASHSDSVGRLKLPRVDISRLSRSPSVSETNHVTTANTLTSLTNPTPLEEDQGVEGDDVTAGEGDVEEEWWREQSMAPMRIQTAPRDSPGTKAYWTVVLIGSGVFLAVAAFFSLDVPRRTDWSTAAFQTRITTFIDSITERFQEQTKGTMDVPLAETLVRRWHSIKSDALGSEHEVEKLAQVLEGNMLRQWKERAHSVKTDGWHWEYSLLDLAVDKVSVSRDGRQATIEASIKEKAELIDMGRKADWYSTSYTVQYDLVMKKQGWIIYAARVVYESP